MNKLYLVSPLAQKKETDDLCFKKCGKVIIGCVMLNGSPFLPCRERKCEYEEETLDLGEEIMSGKKENIFVRKLKMSVEGL